MRQHGGARPRRHLPVALLTALAVLGPVLPPGGAALPAATADSREARSEVLFREARQFALRQLARTDRRLRDGRFPTVAPGQRWHTSGTNGWLAGFFPGQLWTAYELTGQRPWARRADARQAPLVVRADDTSTHDLGFLLQTSFGRQAALTGRDRPRAVILRAAAALASRWAPQVGATRSWDGPDGQVTVIVDNLVNLELLFAASRSGGRPEWHAMAVQHALTTAAHHLRPDGSTTHVVRFDETTGEPVWKGTVQGLRDGSTWARGQSWAVHGFTTAYRESGDPRLLDAARRTADFALAHHLRPDGSTTHVVRFDETTGEPVWKGTVQGLRDGSTWARGQSWAVHGFTTAYRESGDPRLLDAARRTADFALAHLPRDGVPYWDYDAPSAGDRARDTTAAAVLASGLLELARLDPDPARRATYAAQGLRTLRSLAGPRYLARGTRSPAVLRHGHHSPTYPDSGVTYGDHYLLEALLRAQLLPSSRPELPARVSRPGTVRVRADLRSVRRVSGISLRWRPATNGTDAAGPAVRFLVETSRDGDSWVRARGGVSSGRVISFETYDVADRRARYVRVTALGPATSREVRALKVRG